jgi:histidinol-phosphate aminotransferase
MKANSYIKNLAPYQPGLPIDQVARQYGLDPKKIIKLASNENPLGMSPKAKDAMLKAASETHRYPEQYNLLQALAAKYNVSPEQITLGNGSNDILDLIARTYLNGGHQAVSSQYAFAIYQIATYSTGAKNIIVPATHYGHDIAAMVASIGPKTKVLWIANPNNPTGTFIPYAELYRHLLKVPKHVAIVLDEAYYEYLSPEDQANTVDWLKDLPNLILVRTFSKIYGLAGLRIGYAISSTQIAQLLNRIRQPFNVSTPAIAAATAALADIDFANKSRKLNNSGRQQLQEGLDNLQCRHLQAKGNFITFKVPLSEKINKSLLSQGVIVRPLTPYGMQNYLRVTIGTAAQNKSFLKALATSLKQQI